MRTVSRDESGTTTTRLQEIAIRFHAATTTATVALCLAGSAAAADIHWTALSNGFWDSDANWSTGAAPGTADNALIDVLPNLPLVTVRQSPANPNGAFTRYQVKNLTVRTPFGHAGGSLLVTGNATFEKAFTWSGGGLHIDAAIASGTWTFQQGIQFTAAGLSGMNGGAVVLQGDSVFSGGRGIIFGNKGGVQIVTGASVDISAGDLLAANSGLTNKGTIDRSAGTGTFQISSTGGGNAGVVRNRVDTLDILNNGGGEQVHTGAFKVDAGATISFAGIHTFQGVLEGDGDIQFRQTGSVNDLKTMTMDVSKYSVSGTLRLDPAARLTLTGDGTIAGLDSQGAEIKTSGLVTITRKVTGAQLAIAGSDGSVTRFASGADFQTGFQVTGGTLELGGATTVKADQFLFVGTNGHLGIRQGATLSLTGGPPGASSGVFGGGSLENKGTIVREGEGAVRFTVNTVNKGTIDIRSGALATGDLVTFENQGRVDLASGATFDTGGMYFQTQGQTTVNGLLLAATVRIDGGVLGGSGQIGSADAPADVFNGGEFAPGNSPGTLTIHGDYHQAANALLSMELGPVSDRLVIDGDADLAGTLSIRFVAGFIPAPGQSFELLSYGSHTGALALLPLGEAARQGYVFDLVFGEHAATLTVTALAAAVPEPAEWLMLVAGLGLLALRVGRRR